VVTAIVLVRADIQRIPEVAETIAQIPEVSEVYSVTGEFDLVAMVRVRSHEELADVIPGGLNKVPGVTHTETHIAFRTYSRHDLEAAFSLGLDVERFTADLRKHAGAARVAEDVDSADLSGVSGTPTFFVNGQRHYGAYDIETLTKAVKLALARTKISA